MRPISLASALASVCLLGGVASAQLKVKDPEVPKEPPKTTTHAKIQPAPDRPAKPDAPAAAKPGKLAVGDPAPALQVDEWVKGDPVSSFESGKIYVVEFWATWCGPCRDSIPHLTSMQRQFKNEVVVIGMASSEREPRQGDPDKRLDNLRDFIKKQGAKMDYRVAYDSQRAMSKSWMQPAGQQYIPTAFVVSGEGKILWVNTIGDEQNRREMSKVVAAEVRRLKSARPQPPAQPDAPAGKP
jgi:thiol-disulfide isomerase/thioredoxin